MAWPQSPQPNPVPQAAAPAGAGFPLDGVITVVAGALTFLFSFVRIFKIDQSGFEAGWSVWTTNFAPGLFGVGTWIPFFALVAAAIAMARWVVKDFDDKEILGFRPIQLQLVAALFAFLITVGYLISILFSGGGDFGAADFKLGLGMLLLLLGTAGVLAGSVLGLLGGMPKVGASAPGANAYAPPAGATPPPGGQWAGGAADPYAPPPAAPAQPDWQQPAAPAQPEWQQQPAAPAQPDWQQPAPPAPHQWQPPADPQQQWQPPVDPQQPHQQQWQPEPAQQPTAPPAEGGLYDPGTQVIPGPPPAPPADDPQQPPQS